MTMVRFEPDAEPSTIETKPKLEHIFGSIIEKKNYYF